MKFVDKHIESAAQIQNNDIIPSNERKSENALALKRKAYGQATCT